MFRYLNLFLSAKVYINYCKFRTVKFRTLTFGRIQYFGQYWTKCFRIFLFFPYIWHFYLKNHSVNLEKSSCLVYILILFLPKIIRCKLLSKSMLQTKGEIDAFTCICEKIRKVFKVCPKFKRPKFLVINVNVDNEWMSLCIDINSTNLYFIIRNRFPNPPCPLPAYLKPPLIKSSRFFPPPTFWIPSFIISNWMKIWD